MDHNFCFQLLKNIMSNAFQTETFYLKPPYDGFTNIPSEIIKTIFPNTLYTDERIIPSSKTPNRRLFVIKTSLEFYTIHFYMSLEKYPDLIVIGPFRSDSISLDDFTKTLENIPFLSSKYTYFLNYYESLPCVSLQNIINTVSYLINTYMLLPQTLLPIYADFTSINYVLFDFENISDNNFVNKRIEKSRELFFSFLKGVTNGDANLAQRELRLFLTETSILSKKNFSECKRDLHALNTSIQTNIFSTHIQSSESVKLYLSFIDKIERLQTRDVLLKTAYDMCYTYSALFRNNTFPEYSKTVSDVINYIYTHLSEPLSLSVIAEYFGRNASRLSADFKQETGKTITNYIQQTRIHRAMNYLNSTDLSVSEIALATGFDDFAYFSRIFKKHTGHSPKEYRDMHSKEEILSK